MTTTWFDETSSKPVNASQSNPLPVQVTSGGTSDQISPGQVSVTTSATQIVAARSGRSSVVITTAGTDTVYIGTSAVTTTTGIPLYNVQGASITLDTSAAVYGIATTTTTVVGYLEIY